jgi:hypothetical protein
MFTFFKPLYPCVVGQHLFGTSTSGCPDWQNQLDELLSPLVWTGLVDGRNQGAVGIVLSVLFPFRTRQWLLGWIGPEFMPARAFKIQNSVCGFLKFWTLYRAYFFKFMKQKSF